MAPSPLDKKIAGSDSCVICRGENDTNGCHLAVFSLDVAFARHFMATHPPPTLPPYRSGIGCTSTLLTRPLPSHHIGVVLAALVKNYLKWWAIQLAI